jgi:hypothetical protein
MFRVPSGISQILTFPPCFRKSARRDQRIFFDSPGSATHVSRTASSLSRNFQDSGEPIAARTERPINYGASMSPRDILEIQTPVSGAQSDNRRSSTFIDEQGAIWRFLAGCFKLRCEFNKRESGALINFYRRKTIVRVRT